MLNPIHPSLWSQTPMFPPTPRILMRAAVRIPTLVTAVARILMPGRANPSPKHI